MDLLFHVFLALLPKKKEVWPRFQSLLKLLLWTQGVEWDIVLNALGPLCHWQCLFYLFPSFQWICSDVMMCDVYWLACTWHLSYQSPYWYSSLNWKDNCFDLLIQNKYITSTQLYTLSIVWIKPTCNQLKNQTRLPSTLSKAPLRLECFKKPQSD